MLTEKVDIVARLQQEILPLQGYKPLLQKQEQDPGLKLFGRAFPNGIFPNAAIHEFCCSSLEDESATTGFIAGLLSKMIGQGTAVWVSRTQKIFPPALQTFGLAPERIIFVQLEKEKEMLWAMQEALKCASLTAVIGECNELSFQASRRFQLAVEESSVTGFLIRNLPRQFSTTSSLSRWKIRQRPSIVLDEMPGVGFPCWQVDLLRVRNGKPASWQIEWRNSTFHHITPTQNINQIMAKQTG